MENGVMGSYMQCHFSPDACRNYTMIRQQPHPSRLACPPQQAIKQPCLCAMVANHMTSRACLVITYTIGIRFITDYLLGDVYFKTHREHHNLERCRTQFALIASMQRQFQEMQAIVEPHMLKT